ncbi:MAG: hypothetical protein WBV61_07335 [Rhodanobacteraceae bacterium]
MPLTPFLIGLYIFAGCCALVAIGHGAGARRRWRDRRHVAACNRGLWCLIFVLLAVIGLFAATALLGYRSLTTEALVARLETYKLGPQHFAVRIAFPDGSARHVELDGDQWQLDARVIKWNTSAIVLGAPPLYRLDRLSGRYRDAATESTAVKRVIDFSSDRPLDALDAWRLKQRFPSWIPWIDADYGSAAYLPLIDGGAFKVTLAPAGGLIARPADAATADKLKQAAW